jgi:hypothetical protein
VSSRPVTSFVELTFPTADPESQGTGKYQFSGGVKTAFRLGAGSASFGSPAQSFSIQVQQVFSFAGAPTATTSTKRSSNWNGETPGPKGTAQRRRPSRWSTG